MRALSTGVAFMGGLTVAGVVLAVRALARKGRSAAPAPPRSVAFAFRLDPSNGGAQFGDAGSGPGRGRRSVGKGRGPALNRPAQGGDRRRKLGIVDLIDLGEHQLIAHGRL